MARQRSIPRHTKKKDKQQKEDNYVRISIMDLLQ